MTRPPKARRLARWIRKHPARQAPVVCADARGYALVDGVNGHGVCGLVRVGVVGDHLREVQGGGARDGERGAYVA